MNASLTKTPDVCVSVGFTVQPQRQGPPTSKTCPAPLTLRLPNPNLRTAPCSHQLLMVHPWARHSLALRGAKSQPPARKGRMEAYLTAWIYYNVFLSTERYEGYDTLFLGSIEAYQLVWHLGLRPRMPKLAAMPLISPSQQSVITYS